MKAYKSVIKSALAEGLQIHVDYSGEEIVKCGSSYKAAVDAVEAVDESWILVVKPSTKNPGKWVRVAALYCVHDWQADDNESIADWLCNRDDNVKNWADRWFDAYEADNSYVGAKS